MLVLADYFLTIIHLAVTLFNLLGWIHPFTRKSHLICLIITLFSWLGFGIFYGIGYCFLTDWHYQVLIKLGYNDLPYSFITFIIDRIFSIKLNDQLVVDWTMYAMVFIFIMTIVVNLRDYLSRRRSA